jgi:hypothetical protein
VQTYRRFGVPLTMARTRCTFGSHRFGVRRWEWETAIPKNGFFPQMSQTAAMADQGTKAVFEARRGQTFATRSSAGTSSSGGTAPTQCSTISPERSYSSVTGCPSSPSASRIAPGGSNTLG